MKLFSRIFSMLVAAFAFSVLFCTPTFAEDSLSITVDGAAETTLNPNTFGTSSVDVYVTSTSRDGYKLSISDSDENNALVSNHGGSINPLTESVTESNFTTNAWGVKVGDNFLPVPKLTDNVLELANTTKAATNEKHTVTFGMKVDNNVVSGAYSSEVVFTAVANPLVVHKTTLKTGQQVNAAWKTLANNSSTLYTTTDNKITSVQKFTGDFTDALRSAAQDIATADSDWPVYTWFDNGTIYYYTEADEVFFNTNSSYMFYNMQKLASADFNFGVEADVDPDGDGFIASVQDPVYITSEIANMSNMFRGTLSLTSLDVSNWDTSSVTSMGAMFRDASSLTSLDVSGWDTSKVTSMTAMFDDASSLTSLNVSNWDTSSVTSMDSMFDGASALTSLNVSNWNTSKVTRMDYMFRDASTLTSLDVSNWNTSKVTSMQHMFYNTRALTALNVSNWDTSEVTDMQYMFYDTRALTTLDVSNWDTSKVTRMNYMFSGASHLTSLGVSNWDTSKVTSMSYMFSRTSSLTSLDISDWSTSSVIVMDGMFSDASRLTSLDVSKWDTSKVTRMDYMFNLASALTSLDVSNWDTSKVTSMQHMFYNTRALTTLDVSNWDTSSVTNMRQMFYGTLELTTIYASDKFDTSAVTMSTNMFTGASRLVGGNGTVYSANHIDKEYARIDRPGTPGYFSKKIAVHKATLKTGQQVNAIWKSLAKGNVANFSDRDQAITSIQKFTGDFTDSIQSSAMDIATEDSDCPVWSWFDNGTIYYYTEADEVFFNADSSHMFYIMQKLVSVDFNFGVETDVDPDGDGFIASVQDPVYITSNVTSMYSMFSGTSSLTSLDVSNWDTGSVTNMSHMFYCASSLTSLDVSNWDTSKVTDMRDMFTSASSLALLDVSKWDTSSVTDMSTMFYLASSLTSLDVSKWDTSSVTNMDRMFDYASSLNSLDVSKWDTSKVTSMGSMFYYASSLTSLDVSNWDTSKVTNMSQMFYGASSLTTIYASDKFDTSAVTNSTNMFTRASKLVGGNGTIYNASHIDKEYARIDTSTTPGYFTLKTYTVRSSTLKTGPQVNVAWKTLAGDASATYYSDNSNITSIQPFAGNFTSTIQASAVNIATDDSDYPVWSWFDNGTIYYYTESDEVFLNADCNNMFGSFGALTSIDFNFGLATDVDPDGDGIITSRKAPVYITSRVTNMESMFYRNNLAVIDLTGMDTSSVTSMNYMFSKLGSLTTIYASNLFTTSAVTSTTGEVFYGTDSLVGGNGTTWDWDHTGKEYARIDAPSTPGYFTLKTN